MSSHFYLRRPPLVPSCLSCEPGDVNDLMLKPTCVLCCFVHVVCTVGKAAPMDNALIILHLHPYFITVSTITKIDIITLDVLSLVRQHDRVMVVI